MSIRKLQWLCILGLAAGAGGVRAAEISVTNLSVIQGGTADLIVSGLIGPTELTAGYTIVLDLVPQIGATGNVTFTPAATTADEDITEILDPFGGGTFDSLDTNDTLSLLRNGATKSNTSGGTPESITFSGQLAAFPVVADPTATGVWDVRLSISAPPSASGWNPSGSITTTLVEGTITVTIPFCNGNSECDDGNFCTSDACIAGSCVFTDNTLPCDDGDNCTINDVCAAGTCAGTAPDCSLAGDQCNTASCDPLGLVGNCDTMTPVADTTACDDNNACTSGDECLSGVCVPGSPTVCTPLDQCHVAGTCNTVTGMCDNPNAIDGITCDDGDLCTLTDQCTAGICAGSAIDCTSLDDQCNVGVCNAGTGVCEPQPVTNGTACDDTQPCTENDQCNLSGVCSGTIISGCLTCTLDTDCDSSNPDPACQNAVCGIDGTCEFPSNGSCPTLTLTPDAFCYDQAANNTVTVSVDMSGMSGLANPIIAGQFYLEYDTTMLSFVSMVPGDAPFTNQLLVFHDPMNGTIDYAVSVPPGVAGTTANTTMARITFTTNGECDPFVQFRPHVPATNVVDSVGATVPSLLTQNMSPIRIDGNVPVFGSCQSSLGDIVIHADAGETQAAVTWLTATAADNCDGPRAVACTQTPILCNGGTRNGLPCVNNTDCPGTPAGTCDGLGTPVPTGLSGDTLAEGLHTITCTAADSCDGTAVAGLGTCVFNVTVYGKSEMLVDVELGGADANPIRCITFDLWNCNDIAQPVETVQKEIGFTNGLATGVSVLVPSGVYTCLTARDRLHTLRNTAPVTDQGVTYSASFATASGGTPLRGGNLNDDTFLDIIDFALMNLQFLSPVSSNTDCSLFPPALNADLTGDGVVDTTDFSVLSFNFAQSHQPDCCAPPTPLYGGDGEDGPIMSISVRELYAIGQGRLRAADLNGDGWVDMEDVEIFMADQSTGGSDSQPVRPGADVKRPSKPNRR